jgi:hypothetical protein
MKQLINIATDTTLGLESGARVDESVQRIHRQQHYGTPHRTKRDQERRFCKFTGSHFCGCYRCQGTLTEGEGSVQFTSSLR